MNNSSISQFLTFYFRKATPWIGLSLMLFVALGCSTTIPGLTDGPPEEAEVQAEPEEPGSQADAGEDPDKDPDKETETGSAGEEPGSRPEAQEASAEEEGVRAASGKANARKQGLLGSTDAITKPYENIPVTPREFRGAWIATVSNIDWPSEPGLPVDQQKEELRTMMDRAAALNLNAIILQVRPAADAFYHSPFEPWSVYLTGQQGKAPDPFYDPLEFAVKEAHRRGLELHAWFNPFRAYHPSGEGDLAPDHIKNMYPELVVKYGNYYWLDPGLEKVRQYSINIIADVVRRYDIDGVHLDDYFYPYPLRKSNGEQLIFPDTRSYGLQSQKKGALILGDWRRQNVNNFIERLNKEIKLINPHIRFGISPFGIWRPGYPRQIKGLDAFNRIYADARKWLRKGWVDYLAPQLYWPIDQKAQSFPVLLEWWHQQNNKHRHLWPGIYTSRLRSASDAWPESEIKQQVKITQSHRGATGSIHFSMQALMQHSDSIQVLSEVYSKEALVPATHWLSDTPPSRPAAFVRKTDDRYVLRLKPGASSDGTPWLWVVKRRYEDHWETQINPGWKKRISLPASNEFGEFTGAVITAVDELGNESAPYLVREYYDQARPTSE